MATRPRPEAVDEEFLHALYRGGELLAAGKVIEAKDHLERAFEIQPKNEKGQNLLGLTYFKLGLFDRAAEIYEMLVRENPADPTLRVNLGLVYLKTSAVQRAVREFEVATDLAPEHKKSQNYLGLALAQAGEYGRAREHFLLAGSDAMALKMERALSGDPVVPVVARPPEPQPAFAELEGRDVVAEHGGEQVAEALAPALEVVPDPPPAAPSESPQTVFVLEEEEEAPDAPPPAGTEVQIDLMSEDQVPAEEQAPAPAAPAAGDVSWGDQFGLEVDASQPSPVPTGGEVDGKFDASEDPESLGPGAIAEAPPLPNAEPVAVVEEFIPTPSNPPAPPQAEEDFSGTMPTEEEAAAARPAQEITIDLTGEAPPVFDRPGHETQIDRAAEEAVSRHAIGSSPPGLRRAPATSPHPADPAAPPREGAPPTLAQLAPRLQLEPKPGGPFVVDGETVVLHVTGELISRLSGLMGYTGRLEFAPEMKRFRGRHTDKPFGEADARMTRVRGTGLIAVDAGKHLFVPVDLGEDSAYFREDIVFAFEEAVMFENGRVPSDVPPDLDLVHLRGDGKVLLALPGPLKSLEVKMDQPVTLPLAQLVGWHGNLTPRMVPVGWDAKGNPARAGVELSGEGFALFALLVG